MDSIFPMLLNEVGAVDVKTFPYSDRHLSNIECNGGGCSSLHLFKIDEKNKMLFCGMQNGQIKCYHVLI